jgi:hypothetical protein
VCDEQESRQTSLSGDLQRQAKLGGIDNYRWRGARCFRDNSPSELGFSIMSSKCAASNLAAAAAPTRCRRTAWAFAALASLTFAPAQAATLLVGPDQRLSAPSEAARAARDGDTVLIEAAVYRQDAAVWEANDLTIRGINGRASLISDGITAEGKAIWVIRGNNVTIENLEFSGAVVPDNNGAGIRHEGAGLRIFNSRFHHNQMGILTGNNRNSDVLIERSEFDHSARADGDVAHNIYIGQIRSFTLLYSDVHHAAIGHNVKSRAEENRILYNRIADGSDGTASYTIELPWGGSTFVIGNVLQKGVDADNNTMISFATEGAMNAKQELFVVNNTMVSATSTTVFVRTRGTPSQTVIVNNVMIGAGSIDAAGASNNFMARSARFVDTKAMDYRLIDGEPVRDKGVDPGVVRGFALAPAFEYVHPRDMRRRAVEGALDLGAFEHVAP